MRIPLHFRTGFLFLGWTMIGVVPFLHAEDSTATSSDADERRHRHEEMRRKMESLTPEQREQIRKFREKASSLSPAQRREAMAKLPVYADMPGKRRDMLADIWGGGTPPRPPVTDIPPTVIGSPPALTPAQSRELAAFQEKLVGMTPDQQAQAASQLSIIQGMTADQQQWMKVRLQKLQQMSPEAREKLQKNFEKWQQMTPDQREAARRQLAKQTESP